MYWYWLVGNPGEMLGLPTFLFTIELKYERLNGIISFEVKTLANEKKGYIAKISTGYVINAVKQVLAANNNVFGLSEPFIDSVNRRLFKTEKSDPGIKVILTEEGYNIDLFLIVFYQVEIPRLAWELQTQIKNMLENKMGAKVNKINIHIQGVVTQ